MSQPFSDERPASIPWTMDGNGRFHRLLRLHPATADIDGTGGVYVLWHQGTKPHWIYIGQTDDLGRAIEQSRDSSVILDFETEGGVYVTWAPIRPEFRAGVVNFLKQTLEPLITDDLDGGLNAGATPIPVAPPG